MDFTDAPAEAEFAGPQWVFGLRPFGFDGGGHLVGYGLRHWQRLARDWAP